MVHHHGQRLLRALRHLGVLPERPNLHLGSAAAQLDLRRDRTAADEQGEQQAGGESGEAPQGAWMPAWIQPGIAVAAGTLWAHHRNTSEFNEETRSPVEPTLGQRHRASKRSAPIGGKDDAATSAHLC